MNPTELKDLVAVAAKWRANGLITVTPSSIQSDDDIRREKNRLCMARLRAKQKAK